MISSRSRNCAGRPRIFGFASAVRARFVQGIVRMVRDIETILVALDLEDGAELVLGHALGLARKLGSRLVAFHAYATDIPPYPVALMPTPSMLERAAREALERTVGRAMSGPGGVPVEVHVRGGDAAREILAQARESKADLIVVATHGRRGLSRALLGSVAEKVVRLSPVPVLSVRRAAAHEE